MPVTAPADLRERYRRYTTTLRLVQALARCRPTAQEDPTTVSVLIACKTLAQRIEFLERQTDELTAQMDTLTHRSIPRCGPPMGWVRTPPPSC